MRNWVWLTLLSAFVAAPATAQVKPVNISFGYAFVAYLETGGGSAPLGLYSSIATTSKPVGFEADVAYHRDSEFSVTLNTLTAAVGPRFGIDAPGAKPYFHILAGLRYDSVEGLTNTSFGGMAGGGVDLSLGTSTSFRLGADLQMFFDEGESLKTLRLIGGITF